MRGGRGGVVAAGGGLGGGCDVVLGESAAGLGRFSGEGVGGDSAGGFAVRRGVLTQGDLQERMLAAWNWCWKSRVTT